MATGASSKPAVSKVDPRLTKDAKTKAADLFVKIFGDDVSVAGITIEEYTRVMNLLIEMYENSTDRAMKQIHRQEGRILRELLANIEFGIKAEG